MSSHALTIHTHRFSSQEVVINSDVFTWVKPGDVLVIYPVDRPKTDRLAVRVTTDGVTKSKHGRATLQVSVLKGIADRFGLFNMQDVIVARVDPQKIGLDALQLTFDSQFLSRSVLWRISRALEGTCLSRGKQINILGHKLRVQHMFINGAEVTSGLVQSFTKVNFRSRSARIIWMVQLSREMWDFANDGDIFFEKAMKTFFQPCFEKWQTMKAKHSLTVIYYTRTIFHEHSAARSMRENRVKLRPSVCKDPSSGVLYEDVFHTVLENETPSNWLELMSSLKRAFMEFPAQANWTHVTSKEIARRQRESGSSGGQPYRSTTATPSNNFSSSSGSVPVLSNTYVAGGCPAPAAQGNFFEALNLALNIFDLHHMDRDLTRTGQGVVLISPGIGLFEIDRKLLLLTKRRLLDSGVGIDLLCLNSRPLHQVPLLIYKQEDEEANNTSSLNTDTSSFSTNTSILETSTADASAAAAAATAATSAANAAPSESNQMFYNVPHWLRISFPAQPEHIGDDFAPLPTHRMVDLLPGKDDDGTQDGDVWWGSGVVKNRVPLTLQTILKSTFGDRGEEIHHGGGKQTLRGKEIKPQDLTQNVQYPKFFRPSQETASQPQAARESTDAARHKIQKSQSRVRLSTQQWGGVHGALPRPMSMSQNLSSRGAPSASSLASHSGTSGGTGSSNGLSSSGMMRPANRMEYQSHDMKVFSAPRYKEFHQSSSGQLLSSGDGGGSDGGNGGGSVGTIKRSLSHTHAFGGGPTTIYDSGVRPQRRRSKSRLTFNTFKGAGSASRSGNSGGGTSGIGITVGKNTSSTGFNGNRVSTTAVSSANGRPVSNLTRELAGSVGSGSSIGSIGSIGSGSGSGSRGASFSQLTQSTQRQTWGSTQQQAMPDMVLAKPGSFKNHDTALLATSASSDMYLAKTPPMRPSEDPMVPADAPHTTSAAVAARAVRFRLGGNNEPPKSPTLAGVKRQDTSPTRTRFGSPPRSPPAHLTNHFDGTGARRYGGGVRGIRGKSPAEMLPLHLDSTAASAAASADSAASGEHTLFRSVSSRDSKESKQYNNSNESREGEIASNSSARHLPPRSNSSAASTTKRLRNIGLHHPGVVNPFNQKQSQRSQHIEKISSSRRRWRHLYTKAFDALRGTGLLSDDPFALDWPSLTEPAILPLTMDYFPNPNELRADYTVTELYKLSLPDVDELESMGYKNGEDLVTELVCQRLAQDFQIVTASDGAGEKLSGGLKYHLMYRHIIHKLTYDATSRNIEVTVYTHRTKAEQLGNAQYYYPYTVFDLYDHSPHSVGQTFTSIIPSRWGYLDGVIVGYNDQYDKSVRYRRLHYLLIPPLDEVRDGRREKKLSADLPWSLVREDSVKPVLSQAHAVVKSPKSDSRSRKQLKSASLSSLSFSSSSSSTHEGGEERGEVGAVVGDGVEEKEEDSRIKFFLELVEYLSKMSIGDLSPMSVDIDRSKRVLVQLTPSSAAEDHISSSTSGLATQAATIEEETHISGNGPKRSRRRRRRKLVPQRTTKIRIKTRSSKSQNAPQWIFVEYDKSFRTDRCYRITLQFLVCTGATMLDFTSSLNRVCKKGNILMMQVPEYTHPWQNPYIHAFLVPLHLPMPLSQESGLARIVEDAMVKRYGFVLEADFEWSLESTTTNASSPSSSSTLLTGNATTGGQESDRWAGKQYLHRTGGAFVRILKDGLLWIPNRMTSTRGKWKDIQQLFVVFRTFTQSVMKVRSLIKDIVMVAIKQDC